MHLAEPETRHSETFDLSNQLFGAGVVYDLPESAIDPIDMAKAMYLKVWPESEALHRIRAVRRERGLFVRAVAEKLDISPVRVQLQEDPYCNLTLEEFHRWLIVLDARPRDVLASSAEEQSPRQFRQLLGNIANLTIEMSLLKEKTAGSEGRDALRRMCLIMPNFVPAVCEQLSRFRKEYNPKFHVHLSLRDEIMYQIAELLQPLWPSQELQELVFPERVRPKKQEAPEKPQPIKLPAELHRLQHCREVQWSNLPDVAQAVAAARGISVGDAATQEKPQQFFEEGQAPVLTLEDIYAWADALELPAHELFVPVAGELTEISEERGQLYLVGKHANSVRNNTRNPDVLAVVTRVLDALEVFFPDIKEAADFPTTGTRRRLDEYGMVTERVIPDWSRVSGSDAE